MGRYKHPVLMLRRSQLFAEAEELDQASNTTMQNTLHDDNRESHLFCASGQYTNKYQHNSRNQHRYSHWKTLVAVAVLQIPWSCWKQPTRPATQWRQTISRKSSI